ncbi:hypothetical protein SAMN05216589_3114 [Halopseudomonas bauzanensis]|uniref:Uncharacterized protein n=1 Tax=Halopseudomonas bauzanensis TaxID=653930 RepID=A0A1H9W968_9GAMM|nr:hypothetical protein SAMN05216589_3114 [Halopseudomonas bauzanensis]SFM30281.1 hypothetical protein SAMN04487855_3113 [Halopseudomonas bauzanensis]
MTGFFWPAILGKLTPGGRECNAHGVYDEEDRLTNFNLSFHFSFNATVHGAAIVG